MKRTACFIITSSILSLSFFVEHGRVAQSNVKYYKLSKVLDGKLQSTAGRDPAVVSADSRGGEVVVKVKMTQRCIEGQKYTWGFNKDVDILRPGDSFDVEGTALTMPDDCYTKRTPFFLISGSDGSLMARSIVNRLGSNEQEGSSKGKRYVTGHTPRIYATSGGETKSATIKVREDASSSYIWFYVTVISTSPVVSTNESIEHSIVYLYEAVYDSTDIEMTDWTGTWNTSFKQMVLTQSGDQVTGHYTHDNGEIVGTVSGNTLKGTWSESPSFQPPKDAGDFEFTLSPDGKSFVGKWRYGSSGDWSGEWNGTRQ